MVALVLAYKMEILIEIPYKNGFLYVMRPLLDLRAQKTSTSSVSIKQRA